jgi:hypothetical protein
MKLVLKIISYTGLAFTIIPSILVFKGIIEMHTHFVLMGVGLVLWFSTAPFWMKSQSLED